APISSLCPYTTLFRSPEPTEPTTQHNSPFFKVKLISCNLPTFCFLVSPSSSLFASSSFSSSLEPSSDDVSVPISFFFLEKRAFRSEEHTSELQSRENL